MRKNDINNLEYLWTVVCGLLVTLLAAFLMCGENCEKNVKKIVN